MIYLFEQITENEYLILENILKNPNCEPSDFFFDDPTIDGQVQILENCGFITNENGILNITELGRTALVEYEILAKHKKSDYRFKIIQFVIPLFISVLALFVSIISLFLQFQ